jgi:hypothetical protein
MDPDCLMSSIYTITDNQLYQEKFQLFDVGAERSLLALLIKEPDMMAISDQTVPDSYFNLDVNGYIYKVMRFQYKNAITHGWPISFTAQALAAVARQCGPGFEQSLYKKTNNLSSIRDLEVLSQSSKKDDFATLRATLADRAARVAYYDHCRRIQKMALDVGTNADVNSIHDENTAFTSFQQAGDESDSSDHKMALLGDASDDWSLDIEMNKRYGHQGVTSTHVNHLPFLMQRLGGGWRNGGLHVLAARPKVGKSTFLLWQAITAAVEQNIPVLYLDTEMSRKEMFSRAMSRLTGHFEQDLLIGKFMDEGGSHEPIVAEAIYMLKHSQFVYKNIAGERPDQIPVHFRQFRRNFVGDRVLTGYSGKEYTFAKQALVLYDWIKVGSASDLGRNVAEYQQLGFIATMLKYSASSNYLPVIAGAQNNREAIQKKGGPPVDFEESGESMVSGSDRLAQFCSTLMGLRNVTNKEAELITAKFSIRDSTEHDHPQHKLAYNQVLHVYLARAGSNWTKGVPLYMNRGKATYEEMVYTAAGVDTGIKQFMFDIKDKAKQPNTEKAKFTTVATTSSETVPTNPSEAIPM